VDRYASRYRRSPAPLFKRFGEPSTQDPAVFRTLELLPIPLPLQCEKRLLISFTESTINEFAIIRRTWHGSSAPFSGTYGAPHRLSAKRLHRALPTIDSRLDAFRRYGQSLPVREAREDTAMKGGCLASAWGFDSE
jgi:hypothetical protein